VAAGAVAAHVLAARYGVEIVAWVDTVGHEQRAQVDPATVTVEEVDANAVRCPDIEAADRFTDLITAARDDGDSVGGIVSCVVRGCPAGWGEPVFGKTEALLAAAMLSIPAVKGFEIGSGFAGTRLRGSEHNDAFVARDDGSLGTATNRAGGVLGGITSGEPVIFRVAFKPTSTIAREQATVDYDGKPAVLAAKGRHDPCVLPRAVPIVEAMAALVMGDLGLRWGN
jgi:chorismate synthase